MVLIYIYIHVRPNKLVSPLAMSRGDGHVPTMSRENNVPEPVVYIMIQVSIKLSTREAYPDTGRCNASDNGVTRFLRTRGSKFVFIWYRRCRVDRRLHVSCQGVEARRACVGRQKTCCSA